MTLEEKRERLFKDLAMISQLCEVIKICYLNSIKGTNYRNPALADKAEKIRKFAESIQTKELGRVVRIKKEHQEHMEDEHSLQLYRLLNYYVFQRTEDLEQFMDELEAQAEKLRHDVHID